MKHFYIFDLFRNLIRKKNIFAVVYLLLNIALLCWIGWDSTRPIASILGTILLYAVIAFIALSPVGEWILRLTQGCEKIEDPQILSRLEPLFVEVVERAKEKQTDFPIGNNVNLYIKEDGSENAFALGRNTVCVTTGLLACSDEEIKGILGHELGHLATHDTDLILLITVGNLIVSAIALFVKIVLIVAQLILTIFTAAIGGAEGLVMRLFTTVSGFISLIAVQGIMYLWTKLGILMVMKTSRDAEYEADAFSCDLGYSEGLLSFFRGLMGQEYSMVDKGEKIRVFSALAESHPSTQKRIARIHERMGTAVEK